MRIRAATIDDVDAIAAVMVSGWRWAYQGIVPDDVMERQCAPGRAQSFRQRWDPDRLYLLALDQQGTVVGVGRDNRPPALPGYDCEIQVLYVHADHARHGYGRALVAAMVGAFIVHGDKSLCIHTLRENRIGRSFYEKLGGVLVGEDEWLGIPSVWYGWPDICRLAETLAGCPQATEQGVSRARL